MNTRSSVTAVMMCCLATIACPAQTKITQAAADERVSRLEAAFSKGWDRFVADMEKAQSDEEADVVIARRDAEVKAFARDLLELARQAPVPGQVPTRCRLRVLSLMTSDPRLHEFGRTALDAILANPIDAKSLKTLANAAPSYQYALGRLRCLEDLDRLAKKAPDHATRTHVQLASLTILASATSSPTDQERAKAIFRDIDRQEVPSELHKRVARLRFALEHLPIGQVAPDILGKDLTGKALKLSDFRGKVVLLDFWGHW